MLQTPVAGGGETDAATTHAAPIAGRPRRRFAKREQATFRPETPRLNLVQGYLKTIGRSKI